LGRYVKTNMYISKIIMTSWTKIEKKLQQYYVVIYRNVTSQYLRNIVLQVIIAIL